jgi:RNA polymerase sigma-70 factor (ECF subfamily)
MLLRWNDRPPCDDGVLTAAGEAATSRRGTCGSASRLRTDDFVAISSRARQVRVWTLAAAVLEPAVRVHAGFLRERLRALGVQQARLDDAVQDVLDVLARRIDAYDRRFSVRQWMAGVARNVSRRYRRRATREPDALAAEPVGADDLERSVVRREAFEALAQFLDELDRDRWAVFVLSEIEGLRGTEIAAELDVKLSTVYARLRSAQRAFDRALARRRAREKRWAFLGRTTTVSRASSSASPARPIFARAE